MTNQKRHTDRQADRKKREVHSRPSSIVHSLVVQPKTLYRSVFGAFEVWQGEQNLWVDSTNLGLHCTVTLVIFLTP